MTSSSAGRSEGEREQKVTGNDRDDPSYEHAPGDMTSAFRIDFLGDVATPVTAEGPGSGVEGLPPG